MSRVRVKKILFVLAGALVLLFLAASAMAQGAQVTSGSFTTYASGPSLGYEISGTAKMVRTADGKTIVQVHLKGLHPNAPYGAHVHNLPCGVSSGGGHYQDVVGGPVDAVNEIWPGFTTNEAGNGSGMAANAFTARPEAQSVVVHDPAAGNARIACADLY
jgi:Cu-Zn family superoxide dismutase